MPGISYSISQRRGSADNEAVVTEVVVELQRDRLLAWDKCPRLLREDMATGTGPLPILDFLGDAMQGFVSLVEVVSSIDGPKLADHLARLQRLVDETAPDMPVLADISPGTRGGGRIKMIRFDDLAGLLDLTRTIGEAS